jgi:PhoH-like ATPase
MKKNYFLDTNVLLHDPFAIYKFEDNDLIIPIYVIEEIDQFKRESNERGRNARTVARLLDQERAKNGSLANGVPIGDGGTLRVHVPDKRPNLAIALNPGSGDHAILQTAIEFRDASPDKPTIFVTMDVNLRIQADALGLVTEAYENQAVDAERLESGIVELIVSATELDTFFEAGAIKRPAGDQLHANISVILRDDGARTRTALGRVHAESGEIRALKAPREGVVGVRPRNKEQSFALDLLLDDNVRLMTILGKAGTG